jgi:hypothetical protein
MKKFQLKNILAFTLAMLSINFVSAFSYSNWGYFLNSPSELLNNEWVVFIGMFLIVFAVTYMALSSIFGRETPQSPKDFIWGIEKKGPNKMPVVIISAVVALFVSAAFSQSGYLYGYLGDTIGDWALFLMSLIVLALALRMMYTWMSLPGIFLTLIILWFILQGGYYDIVPQRIQTYAFNVFYEIISSLLALLVLILGLAVTIFMKLGGRRPTTH